MRAERFKQRKLKKLLTKIEHLPIDEQIYKLWCSPYYDEGEMKHLITTLKSIIDNHNATGRQLYIYACFSFREAETKDIYSNYINKIPPTPSYTPENWPSEYVKYLCLSAKKLYAPAIYKLSWFYDESDHISGHRQIADRLLDIACTMNYPDAFRERLFNRLSADDQDSDVFNGLHRVAALGSEEALMDLHRYYMTGQEFGFKKNRKFARLFRKLYMRSKNLEFTFKRHSNKPIQKSL